MGARNRKVCAVVLLLALCGAAAISFPAAVRAQNVEPQKLIGEWSGKWIDRHVAKTNGSYVLVIERVEGKKVFGRGEAGGRRSTEFKFAGTFEGNQLKFGKTTVVELTVDGDRMAGTATGNVSWAISLDKKK